jgi:hypothetical protein
MSETVDYVVVVNLLPQDATKAEKLFVLDAVHKSRQTILQSADDAKRLVAPGKPGSKVVVWDAARWSGDIVAYLGVPIELKSLSATPPVPVVPRLQRPTSMGGVHISHGSRNGYHDWLVNCNRSVMVKSYNDFGALMEAKTVNPRTITVIRIRPEVTDEDTPGGNWQWPLAQTQKIARDWMAECYPILDRNERKWFDFVEFINEPDPADAPAMERASAFVQYCMEDAEAHGYKTAIWAWTAGLPRTPRISASDYAQMEATLETLKWAAEHGHALAVHEGSVDPERRLIRQAAQDGTALRYRVTEQLLREKGWPMPHVVVTEAYQESGYRRPDWADWKWYLSELAQNDYVLGCAWFTLGDWSFGEDNVNIQGQLPGFAGAIASLPEIV